MNYRINLYETFDSNGVGIINLFVEIDEQIYNSTNRYVKDEDKNGAISKCFKEIAQMLEKSK
jgi:hypothetical protein